MTHRSYQSGSMPIDGVSAVIAQCMYDSYYGYQNGRNSLSEVTMKLYVLHTHSCLSHSTELLGTCCFI